MGLRHSRQIDCVMRVAAILSLSAYGITRPHGDEFPISDGDQVSEPQPPPQGALRADRLPRIAASDQGESPRPGPLSQVSHRQRDDLRNRRPRRVVLDPSILVLVMQRRLDHKTEEVLILKEILQSITGKARIDFTEDQRRRLAVVGKDLTPKERDACCEIVRPKTILDSRMPRLQVARH